MGRLKGAVSHHEREVAELGADRELAVEYLKAAMRALDTPEERAAGLLALRTVAEAYGGLAMVAAAAGISGTVRNLVCGAIITLMEGGYGDQEEHVGRFTGGA